MIANIRMTSKILIVEDELIMLKALQFRLRKDGYDVHTANDGALALEMINSQSFDLILLDIMLPFVGGLELVSKVKGNDRIKNTPVIMLSAVGLENIILEAFELGADDFITKPFNLSELTIRVRKHVKQPQS